MRNRLFIVEGLPCSGKSTTAAFVAATLEKYEKICFVDEGTGHHPADHEFHALAPAGLLSAQEQVVALSDFSGELFDKLMRYKIYDGLPWEKEMPVMLDKWRSFVADRQENAVYVFNCVLLQNPMCETMMRFGFSEEISKGYITQITQIIEPMEPVVIYLQNTDIAGAVQRASTERPGWLEAVIDYHVNGQFGKEIGAEGFDGYIRCLEERQKRELRILAELPVQKLIVNDAQKDWRQTYDVIRAYLETLL